MAIGTYARHNCQVQARDPTSIRKPGSCPSYNRPTSQKPPALPNRGSPEIQPYRCGPPRGVSYNILSSGYSPQPDGSITRPRDDQPPVR